MACHQHRCCGRAATQPTSLGGRTPDYVLLAADRAALLDEAATLLFAAGASAEPHELGLRINCRGTNWRTALRDLCDRLAPRARRCIRMATIPIGADAIAFQKALLASQPLQSLADVLDAGGFTAGAARGGGGGGLLGDPFKGESLE